jgi:5-methylcytosine-specific restriction endonuclease McrA
MPSLFGDDEEHGSDIAAYTMRNPCAKCGSIVGRLQPSGHQDCVRCVCGAFQYNAPRTETGRAVRTVKTVHEAISGKMRARILERANRQCELCGARGKDVVLHVGHIVSVDNGVRGGLTDQEINSEENLSAMCAECNLGIGKQTLPLRIAISIVMARTRNKE